MGIQWGNGSCWIRDGFARFAGQYAADDGQWVVHKFGTIKVPVTGKRERFRMTAADRIRFSVDETQPEEFREGTLCEEGIRWDDGTLWRRDVVEAEAGGCPKSEKDDDGMDLEEAFIEKSLGAFIEKSSGVSVVDESESHEETFETTNVGEQN